MTITRCLSFVTLVATLTATNSFAQSKPTPPAPNSALQNRPELTQQTAEDEALKSVVQAETRAFYDRDFQALQAKWLHEPTTSRQVIAYGGSGSQNGWDAIAERIAKQIKANPPMQVDLSFNNFAIRREGNLAWLDYQVVISGSGEKEETRERRLMVKSGKDWKIASSVSVATSSYLDSPENIEERINKMGYLLLQGGKTAEAVEMFKLEVRLYPQSWYAYDSLGEAYTAAGQTDLAIQNYEKSISINPKNDHGKSAVAKLKKK